MLVDSGAEGNFLDINTAQKFDIPLLTLNNPPKVYAADGSGLGTGEITHRTVPVTIFTSALHSEKISFLITNLPRQQIILGNTWLKQHDPVIHGLQGKLLSGLITVFPVSYRPGSENKNADALSHRFPGCEVDNKEETILPTSRYVQAIQWDFDQELNNTQPYMIPQDCPSGKKCIPPRLRAKLITCAHNSLATGHPGTQRTWEI